MPRVRGHPKEAPVLPANSGRHADVLFLAVRGMLARRFDRVNHEGEIQRWDRGIAQTVFYAATKAIG